MLTAVLFYDEARLLRNEAASRNFVQLAVMGCTTVSITECTAIKSNLHRSRSYGGYGAIGPERGLRRSNCPRYWDSTFDLGRHLAAVGGGPMSTADYADGAAVSPLIVVSVETLVLEMQWPVRKPDIVAGQPV